MLQKDPMLANKKNEEGLTPLHYAAYESHKELVGLLMDKGADIDFDAENAGTL